MYVGGLPVPLQSQILGGAAAPTLATDYVWNFDEPGSPGAYLDSIVSEPLTVIGTTASTTGKQASAVNFESAPFIFGYLSSDEPLLVANESWTLNFWFRVDVIPPIVGGAFSVYVVLAETVPGGDSVFNRESTFVLFTLRTGTDIMLSLGGYSAAVGIPSSVVTPFVWHMYTLWFNAPMAILASTFDNGPVAEAPQAVLNNPINKRLLAGGSGFSDQYLRGAMDTLSIFRRVLTTEERNFLWNEGNGRGYPYT